MQQLNKPRPLAWFSYSLLTLSVMGISPTTLAQDKTEEVQQDKDVEVIEITGSRIRRTDLETHTAIVSFGSEDIAKTGTINISELLNELPSMVPAGGTETSNTNGYAGLSRQDLRGLGSNRTLVLVNGRRHVPSVPGSSEVDISSIPTALIERVDILTGGASSVYGADAVSGVINVILKKDFTGTELAASYNLTGEGDGKRWFGSLTQGQMFDDNKGSYNYHLSYQTSEEVEAHSRDYVANDLLYITNPLADEPGQPKRITSHRSPLYATNQRVFLLDGRPYAFNTDGSLKAMLADNAQLYGSSTTQLAALSVDSSNENFFTRYQWGRLAVPVDQFNSNFNIQRELSADITLNTELKYVKTQSESRTEPLAEYGVTPLPVDYAYYNEAQQAEAASTGAGLLFGGYFPEMGRQGNDYNYDLFQTVVALEGLTDNSSRWQVSAQHGQTKVKTTSINDYSQENWEKAVWGGFADPDSQEWRSCDADCVPVNVFQPLSQQAINYLKLGSHSSQDKLTQSIVTASLDGDLFELPAGFSGFAVGAEHRREKSDSQPSEIQLAGLGANGYKAKPLAGYYNVTEAFAELRAPVLSDLPMAKSLELNSAWRTAKYSTAGTNHSWTLGLDWKLTDDVKIRASRAKAARAPNISEIYQTESQFWNYVYEVCYSAYRTNGSEYREANCDARGLNNPANYYNNALVVTSGSEDLKAERAYTLTTGVVYSPDFIDNLSLTIDYWDINLVDKIGTLNWSQVYPNCMDSPTLDNLFCDLVEYKDGYTQVNVSYMNLAKHETRGVDYALDYRFTLPETAIQMSVRSNWSRLLQRDLQSDPNAEIIHTLGDMAFPKWRGRTTLTLWTDKASLMLTGHYIGSQAPDVSGDPADYSVYNTGPLWYLDLGLNYSFTQNTSLNLYASNLSGRETPQIPGANTGGASWEMGYTAGLYTTLGRYYTLGLNHKF